jgi:hypothetical protein
MKDLDRFLLAEGMPKPELDEVLQHIDTVLGRLKNRCVKSPTIMRRYTRLSRELETAKREHRGPRPEFTSITSPSEALAERALLLATLMEIGRVWPAFPSEEDGELLDRLRIAAVGEIGMKAPVFLWRNKPLDAAWNMELPDHIVGADSWPYPLMWWTFEDAPTLTLSEDETITCNLQAVLIAIRDDGVIFHHVSDADVDGEVGPIVSEDWLPFGQRINAKYKDGMPTSLAQFVKMAAFLNSKYVVSDSERMNRADRKLLIHAGMPEEADEEVRVVDLRALDQDHKPGEENEGERDWAGRWWVRGHIRAQWCPSTKTHKLIYIAPFIKGPEEKPFLEKVYHVKR